MTTRGPKNRDELLEQMRQPTYEEELRSAAKFLRAKAAGVMGVPVIGVMISADYAKRIAGWLEVHAADTERNRG